MGFKSINNQSNISENFEVGGLIFNSKEDYETLKEIDSNINSIVKLVDEGKVDIKDVFKNIKTFTVREKYYYAREEIDGIFENATWLLIYGDETRFINYEKVGRKFFEKIKVINFFLDSDSDNNDTDSDSDSD